MQRNFFLMGNICSLIFSMGYAMQQAAVVPNVELGLFYNNTSQELTLYPDNSRFLFNLPPTRIHTVPSKTMPDLNIYNSKSSRRIFFQLKNHIEPRKT